MFWFATAGIGLCDLKAQSNRVRLCLSLSLVNNWLDYGGRAKCISWAQAARKNVTTDDDFYSNVVCRQLYKDDVMVCISNQKLLDFMDFVFKPHL
jgi:hypothetical protein